jgi:hypothetical protein
MLQAMSLEAGHMQVVKPDLAVQAGVEDDIGFVFQQWLSTGPAAPALSAQALGWKQ